MPSDPAPQRDSPVLSGPAQGKGLAGPGRAGKRER